MSAIPTQGTTFEKIEIYPLGEEDNLGSAVDLRLGVIHFQYFEDIFSPVITADMSVAASESESLIVFLLRVVRK